MIKLENDHLAVTIDPKGAELKSLYNKNVGIDYMWSGDPAFWGKTSPVLFPVVGSLKGDTYIAAGKSYKMGRHGFAREMVFSLTTQTAAEAVFRLENNDETLAKYPYSFVFDISYSITNDSLSVTYSVTNSGDGQMHFSVGGHPAFKVPLIPGHEYHDYYLEFDKKETAGRWPITSEGLIESAPVPFFSNTGNLPLTKELFNKDALVFKSLSSTSVSLRSSRTPHGLRFHFDGFPYLGIWAAKNADFVCIEPWCGIADAVISDQQLKHKEGIVELNPGNSFERSWKVEVF